jgi:hypothetical protein
MLTEEGGRQLAPRNAIFAFVTPAGVMPNHAAEAGK